MYSWDVATVGTGGDVRSGLVVDDASEVLVVSSVLSSSTESITKRVTLCSRSAK